MRDDKVFTTGEVAKLCVAAPRTVAKWVDSGRLRGYRVPGGIDRRIPRDALLEFLRAHGMPVPLDICRGGRILFVGCDGLPAALRPHLPPEWETAEAADAWEAATRYSPGVTRAVVLDASELGRQATRAISRHLAALERPPRIVVLLPEDATLEIGEWSATDVLVQPVAPAVVARLLTAEAEDETPPRRAGCSR